MVFVVGLGNPGIKYKKTRHNLGFRVLDEFKKENHFPGFQLVKKFNSLISKGKIGRRKILLAKPQTFMNNSGQAVKKISSKFKVQSSKLFIVHDDIDLVLGKIRISEGRGAAGHKGVESIIREIGTKNFVRIRMGIGFNIGLNSKLKMKNEKRQSKIKNLENFVLENFTEDEEKIIKGVIKKASRAVKIVIEQGAEKAMGEFN